MSSKKKPKMKQEIRKENKIKNLKKQKYKLFWFYLNCKNINYSYL